MKKLKVFLESIPDSRILDVGTGSGQFIELMTYLTPKFGEIIGIDLSEAALEAARKKFSTDPRIRFLKMDANHLEFPSGTFEIVCLSNSLHHLHDVGPVLKEMTRVLTPGGFLLICEMISDGLTVRQLSHRKVHHFAASVDREFGIVHKNTYSQKAIENLLARQSGAIVSDSWIMESEPQEPPTKEEVDSLIRSLDRQVGRLGDSEKKPVFAAKAARIQRYLAKNGFDSCPEFLCVLKKKV